MDALKNPELIRGLTDRFLFEKDYNCFFNLMECYVTKGSLYRLQPSGLIERYFKKLSDRLFNRYSRGMKNEVRKTLLSNFKDDFSRLETVFSFLGYHEGFETKKRANALELIMLRNYILNDENLFSHLFQRMSVNREIERFKYNLKEELSRDTHIRDLIFSYAEEFSERFIKSNIMRLNVEIESQMKLSFDDASYSIFEDKVLIPKDRLNALYKRTKALLFRSGMTLFAECYFLGLSDRVMKRYK